MENPKTLEAQNSGGKTLEEAAAGLLDWNIFQGNGTRDEFGPNDVEIKKMLDGTKAGEVLELGVDATMTLSGCVNDFGFGALEMESQSVETVVDGGNREDLESGVGISGVQKSCMNEVRVEEGYMVDTHVDVGDEAQILQSEPQSDLHKVSGESLSVDNDRAKEDRALGSSMDGSQRDDDNDVEKRFEDVKVEKMVGDLRVEQIVEDVRVEKMVENGGIEKMLEHYGVQKVEEDDHRNEDKASGLSVVCGQGEDDGVENMFEDGGVEKMFEDVAVEKLVQDDGVEKAVDDDVMNEAKALGSSMDGSQGEDDVVGKKLLDDAITEDKALGSEQIEPALNLAGNKQAVSGNGISLFVDFAGPPPGFIVDMGSRIASKGNTQEFGDDELDKDEDHQTYGFSVGDIVWVKTKIKTWWPGRIHDPVDASKYGMVSDKQGCLLVGYFGIGHAAWCPRYQLKSFPQYFEQISGQSKARIFVGAVEKALEEFGGRVKLNLTCACVLKEKRPAVDDAASKEGVLVPDHNSNELGDFSITHFDSAKFLTHLKSLAQAVTRVGILEFTVTESQLSAFYSSIGHSQLPVHLLQEGNDAESDADRTLLKQTEETILHQEKNDENEAYAKLFGGGSANKNFISSPKSRKRKRKRDSEIEETSLMMSPTVKESNANGDFGDDGSEGVSEIGAELRERKKSRYLSYPYVNWSLKGLSAEGMAETIDGGPPLNIKSTGEKFWRNWYKRFTGVSSISGNSNLKKASSAELLSEFCSAAIGCQYPSENVAFDSVAWFISNFRISVFHDEPICEAYSKNMAGQHEDEAAEPCLIENGGRSEAKSEPKKRNRKAVSKHSKFEDAANASCLAQSPAAPVQGMSGLGKKRGQPRLGRSKTKSLSGMSDVNTSVVPDSRIAQGSVAFGPLMPCDRPPCDRPQQKNSEMVEGGSQAIGIPDLDGNSVLHTVLVNDKKTIDNGTVLLEKKLGNEAASDHLKSYMGPGFVDANGNNLKPGTLVVDLGIPAQVFPCLDSKLVTSLLSAESKPAPKKRKRQEKVDPGFPVQADGIPDLNATGAECLTPPSKPEWKRRRGRGEALATALLLTFAPGVRMPSKDDLIATFCRFGPLKESETQFLKDPSSAQVVFMESADAGEAFQSLEKNNPFGTNLVSYKRFNLPPVSKVLATSLASPPKKILLSPVHSPAKGPALDAIRQNLQMMTSMLEKSGDTLSPEMRAKLEGEIKGLLQKQLM